jgi:hypothetical protein
MPLKCSSGSGLPANTTDRSSQRPANAARASAELGQSNARSAVSLNDLNHSGMRWLLAHPRYCTTTALPVITQVHDEM